MLLSILFVFSVFAAQLVRLQAIDAEAVAEQGRSMRTQGVALPAKRGSILDRSGLPLAESVERFDIVADQRYIGEYAPKVIDPETGKRVKGVGGIPGAAAALAPLLTKSEAELTRLLTGTEQWKPLMRQATPQTWRKVKELKIPGIYPEHVSVRTYPGGAPVAPLVGWQPTDGKQQDRGGEFLERQYDDLLKGTSGKVYREVSGDGAAIPQTEVKTEPAVPGRSVQLTIDNDLQWFAYNTIAQRVQDVEADAGFVIVMDKQGKLLTVAQYPSFDPLNYGKKGSLLTNRAFRSVLEPGSTAKVMSIGASLAEGAVTPTDEFDVPYTIDRSDRTFKDSHKHDEQKLTVAGIVVQSSNTGTIQVAEKLSPEVLEKYYRAFGVGQLSATQFLGESPGIFAPHQDWNGSQRFTVLFGQGLSMSPIQMAGVFQTVANGGIRIPPTLVQAVADGDGTLQPVPAPQSQQAIPPETARDLTTMMESVVGERGTAQSAVVPGYRIAGKTGTAQDYKGGYTASFIGFAPAEDPQFIVAAIVEKPRKGYYGGTISGPVFQKVMSYALKRYGVLPSTTAATPFPLGEVDQEDAAGSTKKKKSTSSTATTLDGSRATASAEPSSDGSSERSTGESSSSAEGRASSASPTR